MILETITKPSQHDDATKSLPTDEPKDTVQAFIGSCASLTSREKQDAVNETNVNRANGRSINAR